MANLEEMDRFLEKFSWTEQGRLVQSSWLNQEEIEITNNPITSTEIAAVKISQKRKVQDQMASQEHSIKHLEKSECLSF